MTKIDIFSGFLGAGKTTLIKKLIQEAYAGENVVLIENEFGEIGIDGGFMQDAGINVTEMNSGCICCSLVGDFSKALREVVKTYNPDRILIEPSGVGKLSDVIKAVQNAELENGQLNAFCAVVDAAKCKMYMKNFGEFFNDQVENASCIVLSHTKNTSEDKLLNAVELLKAKNSTATVVTADWDSLDGKTLLAAIENKNGLSDELARLQEEVHHHGRHHDHEHECDDPDCCCHHHDHDHEHEHHHGHHHDHEHECDDPDCCCHHHDHDHEHHHGHHHDHEHECGDPDCCCHHHDHDHEHEHHHGHHHGHHHADEVFTSWGAETARKFTKEELTNALEALQNEEQYGVILRAKGIVAGESAWLHFDYVPQEADVREGSAGITGRLCVIGCNLKEDALKALFNV
ncbi:MAG: GTP-binding protein [Clostridia bacterium]|nr:GTP-binding protein [Clostridia bacterium]